jgi:hypothetical protein
MNEVGKVSPAGWLESGLFGGALKTVFSEPNRNLKNSFKDEEFRIRQSAQSTCSVQTGLHINNSMAVLRAVQEVTAATHDSGFGQAVTHTNNVGRRQPKPLPPVALADHC